MNTSKDYLTTGEFAELFGVKKQTMFHYDQMGIFCPEIIGENGYRYYSHNQMEAFSIILMLREMGLSIGEIKAQIDKHSPEDLVELLETKIKEIDERIEHLEWSREYIQRKIRTTSEGIALRDSKGDLRLGEVMIEELPDEIMIKTEYRGAGAARDVNEAISDHFRHLKELGLESCYPDGATISRDSVKKTPEGVDFRYSDYYTVLTPSEAERMADSGTLFTAAVEDLGGKFLTVYDDKGYSNVGKCMLKLMEYADVNGLELGDVFYEDVIWDDLSVRNYEEYLVQISVRIL